MFCTIVSLILIVCVFSIDTWNEQNPLAALVKWGVSYAAALLVGVFADLIIYCFLT